MLPTIPVPPLSWADKLRFEKWIEKGDGCWLWKGTPSNRGYGRFSINNRDFQSHRVSLEHFKGVATAGMLILHRCDTPLCVNPDHLYLGSHEENMRDMVERGGHKYPTCPNGHPYTPENTYIRRSGARAGSRRCKTCTRRHNLRGDSNG